MGLDLGLGSGAGGSDGVKVGGEGGIMRVLRV